MVRGIQKDLIQPALTLGALRKFKRQKFAQSVTDVVSQKSHRKALSIFLLRLRPSFHARAHWPNYFRQQVLPAARATSPLGRVLGHCAPNIPCARPSGCLVLPGSGKPFCHIFACDEDATITNCNLVGVGSKKINPPFGGARKFANGQRNHNRAHKAGRP